MRGFKSSEIDPCIFVSKDMIILVYVDDCILIGKSNRAIDDFISSMNEGDESFDFTDDGDIKNYLGVEFTKHKNGTMELKQEFLMKRIIDAVDFSPNTTKTKDNPVIKPLLTKDSEGVGRAHEWNYRSVIGMLNYLEKTSRPDLAMAVHQCARFCENPKMCHEKALHRIVKYLMETKDKGLIFKPDSTKRIKCFVDAGFAGGWNTLEAENAENVANVLSRSGL